MLKLDSCNWIPVWLHSNYEANKHEEKQSEWSILSYGNRGNHQNTSSSKIVSKSQNEMTWTAGIQMKWICDHRSESKQPPKKVSEGFNRIRTHSLCVRAAVLYQLSYEDPYTGGRSIYWVHQPMKGMKHIMKCCELLEYKLPLPCNHRSESRFTAMVTYSFHHF